MADPKFGEMDTTTLRNRAIEKRKSRGQESKSDRGGFDSTQAKHEDTRYGMKDIAQPTGKSDKDRRKTSKIAGSLPPESSMTGKDSNPFKSKKKKFDEGPDDDHPLGGLSGFKITFGSMAGPEDPKAIKNREKRTGTNTPMYIHNEKSAKSQHSVDDWNEDKSQAKSRGESPAKFNSYENQNTPEARRSSIRSDINKSINQLKRKSK